MLEKKSKRKRSKGVFGLNAIQEFFVVLLGVALLAYVIVVIMGTLQGSTILGNTTQAYNQTTAILGNVSGGITSFFSAINPVYAILAVLVIILVLVVLVKVVQAPTGGQNVQL
jgi:hypothetical protein